MNTLQYAGPVAANTFRNPSASIWKDCPWRGIGEGIVDGIRFFDDFIDFGIPGTQTTEINLGRYKVFSDTAGKWIVDDMPHSATPAGGMGGIISGLCDTDEESAVIGTNESPFSLKTTQTNGKLWFEARVAVTSILTATTHVFVGLAENAAVAFARDEPISDDDVTSGNLAMIGFTRLVDGLGVLNTSYSDHVAAWTHVQTTAGAIVANTFIKLGMKFNPADTAGAVRFYVNGQETTTPLTKATLAGLTHLDGKGLGPCVAMSTGTGGTACYTYIDWIRTAQLY